MRARAHSPVASNSLSRDRVEQCRRISCRQLYKHTNSSKRWQTRPHKIRTCSADAGAAVRAPCRRGADAGDARDTTAAIRDIDSDIDSDSRRQSCSAFPALIHGATRGLETLCTLPCNRPATAVVVVDAGAPGCHPGHCRRRIPFVYWRLHVPRRLPRVSCGWRGNSCAKAACGV